MEKRSRPTGNRLNILLDENKSLQNSQDTINAALEVGLTTQQLLAEQRTRLQKVTGTLQRITNSIPLIGTLTNKIEIRRKRDRLILGSLIGFLMFFCVWYLFG